MPRRILVVSALLAVLVACRDAPTAPDGSVADPAVATEVVSPEVRRAIRELLNDPLVEWIVETMGDGEHATRLRVALDDVTRATTEAYAHTLTAALSVAQAEVHRDVGVAHFVGRAAIGFVLDRAAAMAQREEPDEAAVEAEQSQTRERS